MGDNILHQRSLAELGVTLSKNEDLLFFFKDVLFLYVCMPMSVCHVFCGYPRGKEGSDLLELEL